ncbi:MAG: rhomboid family intramembrane serine protease [Opitutaceae bacterium]
MISDRQYMRETNPARELAPLLWLIGGLVVAFVLQRIVDSLVPHFTDRWVALTPEAILHGRVWTLATYGLLHDPQNLWHLIGNALGILFIGRLLLPAVGARRFLWTFAGGVVAGGVLWLAVNFFRAGSVPLVGASGGSYALFALFCCRFAYERMTFLLFFIIPVTVIPRYLLIVVGSITALFFAFAELFPIGLPSGIAHSAHLAGIIAGIIAHRAMNRVDSEPEEPAQRRAVELPAWMRKRKEAAEPPPAFKVNITARENLKAEVDRILDKINTSGFASLTAEEKRTLDAARNLMSKH